MSVSRYPQITEELLSAYLDNRVSDEERRLIEHAISVEPQLAWQLESLRQTVHMLQSLPALALPRAFTLNQVLLDERAAAEQTRAANRRIIQTAPVESTWWQRWLAIWQSGNPYIRNAAAAALLLLVVLVAGNQLFSPQPQRASTNTALTTDAATAAEVAVLITATEPAQALAQESAQEQVTASAETVAAPLAAARTLQQAPAQTQLAVPVPPREESGSNSAPTVMANLTQAATLNEPSVTSASVAVQELASAGNGGMAATPADGGIAMAPQGPGADQQPLDLAAGGSFGAGNEMAMTTAQAPSMKQGNELTAADMPQTTTAVYAYTAPITDTMTATMASSDEGEEEQVAVAAGASIAESYSVEATPDVTVTVTPTATFTPTIIPTSTLTATATITATLTPTTTPLSHGGPPAVQTMQMFAHVLPTAQSGLSHWLLGVTLTLSMLWWRSRTAAQTTT